MKNEKQGDMKERMAKIIEQLEKDYPDATCTLDFNTPYQLLVAAILAAQCTDERVNQVTPGLFQKYPDIHAFAEAKQEELEDDVRPTGFFRNKAKSIIGSAKYIIENHDGVVPETVEELVKVPGIGRKTANLVSGVVYGHPSVIVDTHVKRISKRMGFTENTNPDKIEVELREILPEDKMTEFNHLIVAHGRVVCKAPKPKCEACSVVKLCPHGIDELNLDV